MSTSPHTSQKTNWVAFIGVPNVGKSTLLNNLVGKKVSIVTHKPQTTRNLIKGIKIIDNTQLIFIDTPGIFNPQNKLDHTMTKLAWQGIEDANQVCLIIDVTRHDKEANTSLLKTLKKHKLKYNLILNKIDLLDKKELLPIIDGLNAQYNFENIFLISALKKSGLDKLIEFFVKNAISEPWPFNKEDVTDAPLKFSIEEVIREKVFLNVHKEIPYSVHVKVETIKEERGITFILADILVKNQGHKKIVIGKNASVIKRIGTAARIELERALNKKIHLSTNVKVIDKHDTLNKDLGWY